MPSADTWSAKEYKGHIYAGDMTRGFDVFRLDFGGLVDRDDDDDGMKTSTMMATATRTMTMTAWTMTTTATTTTATKIACSTSWTGNSSPSNHARVGPPAGPRCF